MKDELGFAEFENELDRRAAILIAQDHFYVRGLIALRVERGLSQEAMAERMGVSQPTVAAFEHVENDPKLSTLRRYAMAVEALVFHLVVPDPHAWQSVATNMRLKDLSSTAIGQDANFYAGDHRRRTNYVVDRSISALEVSIG
jgi:transcriptional regulator with XRE-family HTH domain